MLSGRVPGFRAGDIEPHHPPVPAPESQLGDLVAARSGPHGGDQYADTYIASRASVVESRHSCLHYLVEGESALDMELRGEPDLRIRYPVIRQILGTLCRHPV